MEDHSSPRMYILNSGSFVHLDFKVILKMQSNTSDGFPAVHQFNNWDDSQDTQHTPLSLSSLGSLTTTGTKYAPDPTSSSKSAPAMARRIVASSAGGGGGTTRSQAMFKNTFCPLGMATLFGWAFGSRTLDEVDRGEDVSGENT